MLPASQYPPFLQHSLPMGWQLLFSQQVCPDGQVPLGQQTLPGGRQKPFLQHLLLEGQHRPNDEQ
jgi:hypothetical protein